MALNTLYPAYPIGNLDNEAGQGMGIIRFFFRFLRGSDQRSALGTDSIPSTDKARTTTPTIIVQRTTVVVSRATVVQGRAYVIDGDTIDIDGTRIRLFGIDAPELDHPYGRNAKWALINMCKGQTIRAELEGGFSHDRSVAKCFLPDGRDLSAEMVKIGLAVDWPKFSGGRYSHMELPGVRKRLWRCDARQKGRMPPPRPPD